MLPKKLRLDRKSVGQVLKEGKKISGPVISLKYLISPINSSAFAFIVPASATKKSVIRNKIKRRGKAIVYRVIPRFKKNYWIVIFFGKESVKLKFQELEGQIIDAFQKIKLL